ncbi:MAG TPA: GspE/PulE family protein [Verrucomicrobium sp.]|nr:GspE/PulE family protein [Verrucomicrobium sp.]
MSADLHVDMDQVRIDPAWALRIPVSLALRRRVLPFAVLKGQVYVACADPSDTASLDAVARFTGQQAVPVRVDPDALTRALTRVYGDARGRTAATPARDTPEGDDTVALADELLRAAIMRQASDIHIDPAREDVRVRLRVDGVLEDYRRLPSGAHSALCSRIKVLSGMDIAERRAPQDGGFTYKFGVFEKTHAIDVRVASLPTKYGERMTLRLLASQNHWLTLEKLGMSPEDLGTFEKILAKPHGLVLLTGPTGGGKTTTLYAAIRRLLAGAPLNIITVEDPIEYEIPGVAQVEVDSADKVSFSKALRALLRHDPDVLVIGEIRDLESLDIAVKASLTGHLVFSTLHTNNAVSVVTRLIDMGMPAHLIGATLRLCVAQRLVRRLCQHCRRPVALGAAEAEAMGMIDQVGEIVYEAEGCLYCAGRGYSGRMGLFECASFDAELSSLIVRGAPEGTLAEALKKKHFRTILADGAAKVQAGLTTIHEVLDAASEI